MRGGTLTTETSENTAYSERCYICHGNKEVTIDTTGTHADCDCPRCWGTGRITQPPFLEDVATGRWRTARTAPW